MNTVEILKAARELISDEKRWTQGAYAIDSDCNEISPESEHARCFFAVGAIHKAGGFDSVSYLPGGLVIYFTVDEELQGYSDCCMEGKIVEFNDMHDHPEVIALFDRAIARAESEEA